MTCPKCGAGLIPQSTNYFECDSYWFSVESGREFAQSAGCQLKAAYSELAADRAEIEKLKAFKSYVHKRLDDAGVPANPEPPNHALHGCRIGDRLDVALAALTPTEPPAISEALYDKDAYDMDQRLDNPTEQ